MLRFYLIIHFTLCCSNVHIFCIIHEVCMDGTASQLSTSGLPCLEWDCAALSAFPLGEGSRVSNYESDLCCIFHECNHIYSIHCNGHLPPLFGNSSLCGFLWQVPNLRVCWIAHFFHGKCSSNTIFFIFGGIWLLNFHGINFQGTCFSIIFSISVFKIHLHKFLLSVRFLPHKNLPWNLLLFHGSK